ncbi:MAG TPA: helix-turn-helix domain-containing protein [Casimicrobiaceae bacterium]|nr:helix-turn-helix domain-containing protein [Casimicrobiaceae bacterium]
MNPASSHVTASAWRSRHDPWAERRTTGIEALLHGLDDHVRGRVLDLTRARRRFGKGEALYVPGTPVGALFAIQSGSVKAAFGTTDGRRQLVAYHIVGDIVGFAGLATGKHADEASAAEPTEAGLLPYLDLARLARDDPQLHANLTRLLAVTSARGRASVLRLSSDNARARLASFLLVLGERFARRGHSPHAYPLPLTNHEIGSLIGLTPETVSRTVSAFAREELLRRGGKRVELVDPERLQKIAAQTLLNAASRTEPDDADRRDD